MNIKRIVAAVLALGMTIGASPMAAQQPTVGIIAGRATDEARRPYSNYTVLLRDAESGQIVGTVPLDAKGEYRFSNLELSRKFLVELFNVKDKEVICTEGPFPLNPDSAERIDAHIDCGAAPAAIWLLAATAGAVAAIAVVTESASE